METPARDGHLFDEQVFGGGGGSVFGDERLMELDVMGGSFVGEADGIGEATGRGEAVASGVGGRAGFAFGRDRPVRFFPVGAGGGSAAIVGLTDWSRDGRTILFDVVTPTGSQDIYSVPSAGGKAEPLITSPALEATPTFSRDGKWVYFSSNRSGRFQIWRADPQGRNLTQLTKEGGLGAREADDGYLYYSTQVNVPEIRRIPAAGGAEETVLSSPRPRFFGHWAIVQGRIYFIRQPDDSLFDGPRRSELWAYEIKTRAARKLADLPGRVHHTTPSLAVSPDGGTLVYSRIDSASGDLYVLENFGSK